MGLYYFKKKIKNEGFVNEEFDKFEINIIRKFLRNIERRCYLICIIR